MSERTAAARPRTLGGTAMLRLAAVPAGCLLAGGEPALFDLAVELDEAERAHREAGRRLAEHIGEHVVPAAELGQAERSALLALRRALHGGHALEPAKRRAVAGRPGVPASLTSQLAEAADRHADLTCRRARLAVAVDAERNRVLALAWDLAGATPFLAAFLAENAPEVLADVRRRLERGEHWDSKRLRQRSEYLWRLIGRGAAKTTPRDWLGHVALAPVDPAGAGRGEATLSDMGALVGLVATDRCASEVTENIATARGRLRQVDLRAAAGATEVTLTPLRWGEPGLLCCFVVEEAATRMRQIRVRRTPVLDAVLAALGAGPRSLASLAAAVLGPQGASATRHAVLRGFLAHLHGLGVVEVSGAPRRRVTAWAPPTSQLLRVVDGPSAKLGGYRDVHREVTGVVSAAVARAATEAVELALRVAALRDEDQRPDEVGGAGATTTVAAPAARRRALLALVDESPRPVTELLARWVATTPEPEAFLMRRHTGWPRAAKPHSGYARLLALLAGQLDADEVRLDHELLDRLGAPPARLDWPMDCLVRAAASGRSVLEHAVPAGVADARFAAALADLRPEHTPSGDYRAFLAAFERHSGARFVEVLAPALVERAANTVRRPPLTTAWTGDPDPRPYFGASRPDAEYIPLERITVRRDGDALIAEVGGVRVYPTHHATRAPMPPYDVLNSLLLGAGHPGGARQARLDGLIAALGEAGRVPRLVAGDMVLAPTAWRAPRSLLWTPAAIELAKVRALARLRRQLGLPRFVFVTAIACAKPVPADLDALPGLRAIERVCAQVPGDELFFEEMLPAPPDFGLRERAPDWPGSGRLAAQLLLRLPHNVPIEELAARAAGVSDTPMPRPRPIRRHQAASVDE